MSDFFEKEIEYADPETINISLSSAGKLDAPPTLRLTDYTMEDILKLSGVNEDTVFQNLVEIVQARVQDKFDVRFLHENEFEEILLTIYGSFWSRMIQEYPYPWTEEELTDLEEQGILTSERADKIRKQEEIPRADIVIGNIQLDDIPENFQEPIVISGKEEKIGVRLPRIGDYLLTEEYLKTKYASKDKRFSDVKLATRHGREANVDAERMMEYEAYERERALDFLRVKQSLLIKTVERNGVKKALTTIEEKLSLYKKTSKKFWDILSKEMEKVKFGVNPMVEMVSPFTGETVSRRCLFQVMDFIPTDDVSDNSGFTVSYGDISQDVGDGAT